MIHMTTAVRTFALNLTKRELKDKPTRKQECRRIRLESHEERIESRIRP